MLLFVVARHVESARNSVRVDDVRDSKTFVGGGNKNQQGAPNGNVTPLPVSLINETFHSGGVCQIT